MNSIDFLNLCAQDVLGMPDWRWRRSEAVDPPGTLVLTGAVFCELYKSGPKKGKLNFGKPTAGTERTVVLTRAQRDATAARLEQRTGVCSECFGSGESIYHGQPSCKRCKGTGGVEGVGGVMASGDFTTTTHPLVGGDRAVLRRCPGLQPGGRMTAGDFAVLTHPIARRTHRCAWCGATTRPGDVFARLLAYQAGRVDTEAFCTACVPQARKKRGA